VRVRVCRSCHLQFEGHTNSVRCRPCRLERERQRAISRRAREPRQGKPKKNHDCLWRGSFEKNLNKQLAQPAPARKVSRAEFLREVNEREGTAYRTMEQYLAGLTGRVRPYVPGALRVALMVSPDGRAMARRAE